MAKAFADSSRKYSLAFLTSVISLTAVAASNGEVAHYRDMDKRYEIILTRKHDDRVSDYFSFISRRSAATDERLLVPRIEGRVAAAEISLKKDRYPLVGDIRFSNKRMTVHLYFDDYERHQRLPYAWNGEYMLESQR